MLCKYIMFFFLGAFLTAVTLDDMFANTANHQVIESTAEVTRYQNQLYERYSLMLDRLERLEHYHK